MFLFTTPPAPPAPSPAGSGQPAPVIDAIRRGADATGAGFDYLLKTAQRESALDPAAKARTSSATGLFQFIEQTWLSLVRDEGAKYGLGDYAKAVQTGADGRAVVPDADARREILALRNDPKAAATMAGELALKNREFLQQQLGRDPTEGELYIAHVLGAQGASRLVDQARNNPTSSAAAAFPDAAAANRGLFFDKSGRARGAAEVYAVLASSHSASPAVPAPVAPPQENAAAPAALAQSIARGDGPVMHGLFRTEGPRGPVSDAVARLWVVGGNGPQRSAEPALRFFPRGENAAMASVQPPAASPAAPSGPTLPEPPRRPDGLASPTPEGAGSRKGARQPLDLSRFMTWRSS